MNIVNFVEFFFHLGSFELKMFFLGTLDYLINKQTKHKTNEQVLGMRKLF